MTVCQKSNWTDELYPKPYIIINNELYMEYERNGDVLTKKLCNFLPYITGEIIHDDGVDTERYVLLQCIDSKGNILPEIELKASDLANTSLNWIVKHWGARCNIMPGYNSRDHIRHAIQCTVRRVITETLYNHFGWRKVEGRWHFLMTGQSFKVKSEGALKNYFFKILHEKKSVESAFEFFNCNVVPDEILYPLLSFVFLTPLNHFLKIAGCETKTVMCLVGKTGTKKSTLAALMLSFFGSFTNTELPLSFRDTANSIVHNAFFLKDVLTVIDDYHPSTKNEEQQMNSTAQTIMRAYGDRVGRNKLRSDSSLLVGKPPRGNALITGEQAPDITESGVARTIQLEIKKDSIAIEPLCKMQNIAAKGYLSSAMYHYLKWIEITKLSNEHAYAESLKTDFDTYRLKLIHRLNADGITYHARLPEVGAHLKIGLLHMMEYFMWKGMLSVDEYDQKVLDGTNVIYEIIKEQAGAVRNDEPSTKFISKLNTLLDSGKAVTDNLSSPSDIKPHGFIGYEDNEYYYLLSDIAHSMVKNLCSEQGELFTASTKSLQKQLKEEGYLSTNDGRSTTVVKVAGHPTRLLKIPKNKLDCA
ncbi:MAG: DUF927 domain-containing protein [Clostridia bacterium]|nr:DUF927 domain-containing protein [Clostridia bacterium]